MDKKYFIFGICVLALGAILWIWRNETSIMTIRNSVVSQRGDILGRQNTIHGESQPENLGLIESRKPEFVTIGARYKALPHGEERTKAIAELIRQWICSDPLMCMEYLSSLGGDPARPALSKMAMQLWLARDLVVARSFAETQIRKDDKNAKYYLEPVLEQFLADKQGFGQMTVYIDSLPQSRNIYAEVTPLFASYLRADSNAAVAFAKSRSLPEARSTYLQVAGGFLAASDPEGTLSKLSAGNTFSPEETDSAISALLREMPDKTLAWLLSQQSSPAVDSLKLREAKALTQADSRTALSLAASLAGGPDREAVIGQALTNWAKTDYASAENWAVESNVDTYTVARALLTAGIRLDNGSFESKLFEVASVQNSQQQLRKYAILYSQWFSVNPTAASGWLDRSSISDDNKVIIKGSSLFPVGS